MDLTPGRQRLLFVVIAVVLVGLGAYLISNRHSGPAAAPATTATPTPAASGSASADVPPSALPSATPVSTAGGAEIYQWLPFSADDLAAAVQTTDDFAKAYATWSYKTSKEAYGAQFKGLTTAQELSSLEYTYTTAGVAQARTTGRQVSTGTGSITRISTFGAGPVSITFVVGIDQKVTSNGATSNVPDNNYTITVVSSGGGWQVSDIELQGVGNS
jgi:hypothetical protein